MYKCFNLFLSTIHIYTIYTKKRKQFIFIMYFVCMNMFLFKIFSSLLLVFYLRFLLLSILKSCAFFLLFPGFPQLSSFPAFFSCVFPSAFHLSSFPAFQAWPSAFLMASSFVPTTVSRL